MNNEINDNLPVRETAYMGRNPVITRDLSDDRLLQVSDENMTLKRHVRKQDDRIRQLATKLVRVISDKSKRSKGDDILIEDQKSRIMELETQMNHLRSKLSVARQQLGSYTKLVPGVASRQARSKSSRSSTGTPTGKVLIPDQVTRLLLDAKSENHALKDQVKHLHERWVKTNQELLNLKEQLKVKEVEHHDEMIAVRSHTQMETALKQKKIAENIQLIRLQRDSKRTANWLATYEAQCRTLEVNYNATTENVSQLEAQLSTLQEELRSEQSKSLNLLKQVEENASSLHQLKEVNAQIIALQDENIILREANETFLAKSLESCTRVQQIDNNEKELKYLIEKLEETIKMEIKGKSELILSLTQEKAKSKTLEQEMKSLDKKFISLSTHLESTTAELEKTSKNNEKLQTEVIVETQFVTKPCVNCPIKETECAQFEHEISQLKTEIGRAKELLKTQISINKEYQDEIEALTSQLNNLEILHEKERKELMAIFTEKTNKMTELEHNLELIQQRKTRTPPLAFISYENFLPSPQVLQTDLKIDNEAEIPVNQEQTGQGQPQVQPNVQPQVQLQVQPNVQLSVK